MRVTGGYWRTRWRRIYFRQSEERLGGRDSWGFLRDSESPSLVEGAQRSSGVCPSWWEVEYDLVPGVVWSPVQDTFQYTTAVIVKVWSGTPGLPETFSGGLWGPHYFKITCFCLAHLFPSVQWVFYCTFGRSTEISELTFSKWPARDVTNHAWVKHPLRMQIRSMHLKVGGNKNLADRVSDSTSQITFKKLPFVELWGRVKEECPQLSEKELINTPPVFNYMSVWGQSLLDTL